MWLDYRAVAIRFLAGAKYFSFPQRHLAPIQQKAVVSFPVSVLLEGGLR
jgi:hypothetical protein